MKTETQSDLNFELKLKLKSELWITSLAVSLWQACNRNSVISSKKLTCKQDSKSKSQKLVLKSDLKFNQIKIQSKLDLKKQFKFNLKLTTWYYKHDWK